MAREGGERVCVIHQNIPNMLSRITGVFSKDGINIENMQSKSKKDYAYTILDITGTAAAEAVAELKAMDGVVRIRVIK